MGFKQKWGQILTKSDLCLEVNYLCTVIKLGGNFWRRNFSISLPVTFFPSGLQKTVQFTFG